MGTAFNKRHMRQIRGVVPRVVLVFDADAGGDAGVDRALEVFVSQEMDLRIATLPEGLDLCDLLAARGPGPFREALEQAPDVLEYKLCGSSPRSKGIAPRCKGLSGRSRKCSATLAAEPAEGSMKVELMVNRIAHRLNLKEETLWDRLKELRGRCTERVDLRAVSPAPAPEQRSAPAAQA